MGLTKTELFTGSQNQLARWAKVLGHPARIAILQVMLKHKACICGSLVEELGLAQSTISQHLRELKEAGLIQGTVEGTSVCYCIEPKAWAKARASLNQLFDKYTPESNDCC
ncbi:MAG: metalloregulator ArsR/SmtB family transcription factor [Flavobacteriales bacterium]|jgi:DNA-binding transcriptional ArsR family regulator|nr:metalloregulator ArsR/SmtB family transcription factor [Flavobacteriales bacterium]